MDVPVEYRCRLGRTVGTLARIHFEMGRPLLAVVTLLVFIGPVVCGFALGISKIVPDIDAIPQVVS